MILVWLNLHSNPTLYNEQPISIIIFFGSIFSTLLICLAVLDFRYFWLPQSLTSAGILIGITGSLFIDLFNDFYQFSYSINSIIASFLGFIFFYLLSFLGEKFFKKPVIGGGDAKLGALLGSWLGVQGFFISVWLAFVSAGLFVIFGLILKKIKRNQKLPFKLLMI